MKSLLPYIERSVAGKTVKLLIDTGTSKNYIKPSCTLNQNISAIKSFRLSSIHGESSLNQKCTFTLFGETADFYLLPHLASFDGIIGLDSLMGVNANVDLKSGELVHRNGIEKLKFHKCLQINFALNLSSDISTITQTEFKKLIDDKKGVFSDPEEKLPFNTNIVATIRTIDDSPVYVKHYPYPAGVTDFVNEEVERLLKDGIIRPSRSPYNNPIWVVDKKGCDDLGNRKKRLVFDFRKLNDKTVEDKYPIPNINNLLNNLRRAKFYTTMDLTSGFHQIVLAEKDREKTAFNVNNGKYEFCRLPFGLKNAPSIFQRAIDDVLRENIGKFLGVYIDDLLIYSETEEDHIKHIEWVLDKLYLANMRVNLDKSQFFKTDVEYLGFIVSREGIKTCPSKVEAIRRFPAPETLHDLRSFLGLAGYYRRFVKDYADIAKPLTDMLRGDNGKISANKSKRTTISLNEEQTSAFDKLRSILSSEDVVLLYPDYTEPFELTTDASSKGIGAVLSQKGRPLTMISRSLKDNEINFATNERELLAIVWALKKLRNYLYGVKNLIIYTDHQPLSYAISDSNCNAKLKRWMAFIDDHNAKILYKPGKDNVVADALSRQFINTLDNVSTSATIHSEPNSTNAISKVDNPINCYNNQIIIEYDASQSLRTLILFREKKRHIIHFSNRDALFDILDDVVVRGRVNAIKCELTTLADIQDELIRRFPLCKFKYAPNMVIDLVNEDEQKEVLLLEHNRGHRCVQNVVDTVLRDYYFPRMGRIAAQVIGNCSICLDSKYPRKPILHPIGKTPIPSSSGERIHIDIFSTDRKHFLTCVDKFSKFAMVQPILSRSITDITPALLLILNCIPNAKNIYCDNEASFMSHTISNLLAQYGASIRSTPPNHSISNGQVERFHSTLLEIARCLKEQNSCTDTTQLILMATIAYNNSIHSVTREKPISVIHSSDQDLHKRIKDRLEKAQEKQCSRINPKRKYRNFNVGDYVRVKKNRRIGNKLCPRFIIRRIQADLGSTVLIRGREVHKDNIR